MRLMDLIKSREFIELLICLLLLAVYVGHKMDWENILQKNSPVPVHMGKQVAGHTLPSVKVLPIPDSVYKSLPADGQFERYLTGNHKYVFFFTYSGCPYARAFTTAFKHLFSKYDFAQYYRKRVITVGRTTSVSCPGHRDMNCATAWVYQTCFGNLCIFNPQRREVVVDSSQNASQIEKLLEQYKEW